MKRIGNIYEDIATYANCRAAIERASIGKSGRGDVRMVKEHMHKYTLALLEMLQTHELVFPF